MPWMSILAKKSKTPRKTQKKQTKKLNTKMSDKEGADFTLSLPREAARPLPHRELRQ